MGFTDIVKMLATSGGAKILGGLTIFFLVFGVIGFFSWRFFRKNYVYKYHFLLLTSTGNFMKRKGKITKNAQGVEVFELDGSPGKYLDIKEPNMMMDGRPQRIVAYDGQGNIAWCNKLEFDKVEYLKTALIAPERQMAAQTAMDAGRKYGKVGLETKFMIGFSVLVIFIMVIGMYANGKLTLETVEQASKALTTMNDVAEYQGATIDTIKENTEIYRILLKHNGIDLNYTINEVAE